MRGNTKGRGEGEGDKNEFNALALVVRGESFLSFTPTPPKEKHSSVAKGREPRSHSPGSPELSIDFLAKDIARVSPASLMKRMRADCARGSVYRVNIISQSNLDIASLSTAERDIEFILFRQRAVTRTAIRASTRIKLTARITRARVRAHARGALSTCSNEFH